MRAEVHNNDAVNSLELISVTNKDLLGQATAFSSQSPLPRCARDDVAKLRARVWGPKDQFRGASAGPFPGTELAEGIRSGAVSSRAMGCPVIGEVRLGSWAAL